MRHPRLILKPGHDRPVRRHHPWIFSGAVAELEGRIEDGEIIDVYSSDREWLARGYLNRRSQIIVRLLTWNPEEAIDESFWERRIDRALAARHLLRLDEITDAYRLVYAESDWIPGLLVDRYRDFLVIQSLTLGIERRKELLVRILTERCRPTGIYERSDLDVRAKEGLPPADGVRHGEIPPERIVIREHGYLFRVDIRHGQKTGFYLDQRENRRRVAPYLAGARVLNAFSYTGAFAVYALAAGAESVVNLDTSAEALADAAANVQLNGFPASRFENVEGDAFRVLRQFRASGRRFQAVILDPPKFAFVQAHLERAARGYKDINLQALHLLESGGILVTFSCSGLVSADLFQKIVFAAAEDADREVQILERLGQAPDHPVRLSFPEGEYLKGLICRVW
ncbi:class I SAM-dependent rRNA methyltransferase [Thermomicrobium sp. CFH 73360]|uniref:class I SAM-dependent rRNA methyltransferase n=1 Tax=Thermomicrobium sp. CFH 73360 TaxID=2951987 RepID=UPI002076B487|nr:class I SAM-dependent rRNA methyltransferase [Thermomicrobium sp. CFH 73360]MCM8745406.1 class I SAM-dependent rRNA methyltransferase [Thermomicrobium sp. CFH 73360]